jgi:hypothetical protein
MAAYARLAKDSALIEMTTEIKVRAERRCGELLAATERNKGVAARGERDTAGRTMRPADAPPTLADMGLSKSESSGYQQLAAMPAEHFEIAVINL